MLDFRKSTAQSVQGGRHMSSRLSHLSTGSHSSLMGKIAKASAKLRSMPKEDVIGKKIQDIFHEKNKRIFDEVHRALYQTLDSVYSRFRVEMRKQFDTVEKERKKLEMIKLKKKERIQLLGRNSRQKLVLLVKVLMRSLNYLKSIHNDNDFYRVKKIFDIRLRAKDDEIYEELLRAEIDNFINSPYKADLIFSLKYLKSMVRTDYAKFGKIVCEVLIESIFPYLIEQKHGDQLSQSLVLEIITLLLSKPDARNDLYDKNILDRFFTNFRQICHLSPQLQDKISWLATSICHHEELVPFIIDIEMLDFMLNWIDTSKEAVVKSNVMLAFGLLTDWKEMAPFLVQKGIIDAVFRLCHSEHYNGPTPAQTKENAYLALAQFGLRHDLISTFAEKPVVQVFANFFLLRNQNIQTNVCWLFVALCNGLFSGRQLLLWGAIPTMLRACCQPSYEKLYHIIIAGFVARGMEFTSSSTPDILSMPPVTVSGAPSLSSFAGITGGGGGVSSPQAAEESKGLSGGTISGVPQMSAGAKLSKIQQQALALFERFQGDRHRDFVETLFATARHDNEHKKMLGFKGIKAYLNSVKNIPVGEIEEMMAILIEASFSKNKDIVLSASEAFTYAVTEYLKVWKEKPETIPLLVKGLLQYTAIDIKLVEQRAFSLLLVICYFGKENASFGKAVLEATALPSQVKLEQFLTYNTQHLERLIAQHAQIRLQKENELMKSGSRPATLFGLKPVLELLLVSTKKRQSEILKDICKMLRKENVELDNSIFEALQLFFRYRDKNIIESLATAFEKVSEKLLHQEEQEGLKVDGSLLLKYFSLIQSLIESNVEICLKVAKSLHTLTDLFSVDISDCAKVVINNLLQCLLSLSKFFKQTGQQNTEAASLLGKGALAPPQPSTNLLSPRSQSGERGAGGRSHRALPAVTEGTEEEESSVLEFARQGTMVRESGLGGEQVQELLSKIQIYESEGAVFKIHNTLVRIFINLMIKESGSLLITYEEGIEFTKSLIVKSTQEFPEYMQDEIRRLVNARIKSFRFQEIFLDAGFYKYVKQLFNVKNQELLRALIKIYEILITLNFEANQELVNSILAELSEILAFSSRHEVIAQIIAIFISSSPQSLSFITLEQLGNLYSQMARTSNLDLLLEITKLIIIYFRDVPELSVAQPSHRSLISSIVTSLVLKLKENQPKPLPSSSSSRGLSDRHQLHQRASFILDESAFASQFAQNATGSSAQNQALAMQKALEKHNQHRKLIQVLLSYAKEIASIGEKSELPQSLLCDTDGLRVIGEAVVRQTRNEEFLMQLLRVCVAGCGSLSMKVSQEQSRLQAYISRIMFQLCEDIINVIQKSSENYYCKVLANDLFNLTMLMNLPTSDPTLIYFLKLTRLFKHHLDQIAVNSISFFGSYFVIHCDTHGLVNMYQQLEIVTQLGDRLIEQPPLKSVLGQNHKTVPLLIELFCSLHKLFKQELLLTPFPRKQLLIAKLVELLGSSTHVPLLQNIANTLRVMLQDPQCDALFFEKPESLATLNALLLRYVEQPLNYATVTVTLLESIDLASRNANNHIFLLEAELPSQLHALLLPSGSAQPSLELELNIAAILHNLCHFSSPETVLACLEQKCLASLELMLLSKNVDYQKGVIVLQTMFAMLDAQHDAVAPLLSSLTSELINLSKVGKFFKHRKIAEAILTELGIDVTPFSPNQEQDMLTIFKQFNIGASH